jgi:nitroreductase
MKHFLVALLAPVLLLLPALVPALQTQALAQPPAEIVLPPRPERAGLDLVQALEQRQTTRQYKTAKLTPADLSAILWSANGVNRPNGKRTAPSAHGKQYVDIYLVGEDGAYLYDAPGHKLVLVNPADLKGSVGVQAHVAAGSHVLVLVADFTRMGGSEEREYRLKNAAAAVGCIAQNVYLMCAARNVGTVLVAGLRPAEITAGLKLTPGQEPLYVMPLGPVPGRP